MKNWKTIHEDIVFEAFPYVKVVKQTVELPNGEIVEDYFQAHLARFVVTVPILENGKILTIRQYKHGIVMLPQ